MTTEQQEALVAAAWGNTVHFSDKALLYMTASTGIIFNKTFNGGPFVCALGDAIGAGDTLQQALDNAIALIDQRNVHYSKTGA